MELAQVHSMTPLSVADVESRLRAAIPTAAFHRRGALAVAVGAPWRPADVFPGALERLVWTARFDTPGGTPFSEEGAASLGRHGILRRHAPVHPGELYARALGHGLFLWLSDATRTGYAAVYREHHLRWSLLLEDQKRLVRCDGQVVIVDDAPRIVPEGDRTGVLLAGLGQWLREPVAVDAVDRFQFAELLDALVPDPGVELVVDGGWDDAPPLRAAASR